MDPDGTCRIYYFPVDLPVYSLDDAVLHFPKAVDVSKVELFYNMQPDDVEGHVAYRSLPEIQDFRNGCPVWHFVVDDDEGEKGEEEVE